MRGRIVVDLVYVLGILATHAFAVLTALDPGITFNESRRREILSNYPEGQMDDQTLKTILRATFAIIAVVTLILLVAKLVEIG